ncbi:hypothetical protein BDZ88DRAFT_506012 [Geranomyces variabilis]|nr:hypothetical protein BDZ88DRAFT_506012 [Geranomyces variabilis]KAJ3137132.1 hypothetical protein HDU90_002304 [Geranomyces variabilis]
MADPSIPPDYQQDWRPHHKQGNNDIENLQPITREENARYGRNLFRNNTSRYNGVSWSKDEQKWKVNIRVGQKNLHLGYAADINIAAAMRAKANIAYDFSQAPHLPCGNPALVPDFDPLVPLGRNKDHHLSKYHKYTKVQVSNNCKRYTWVNRSADRDTVRAWRDEIFARFGFKMTLNGSVHKIENTNLLEEEVKAGNVVVCNEKSRKEREKAKEKAKANRRKRWVYTMLVSCEREKADGVATVPGQNDILLAHFEDARPIATQRKKREDLEKIARNLVYGAQSAGQYLVVSVLEHHGGALFLHQVDQASIPVQTHDVLLFAELYTCRSEIDTTRVQIRSSRKSNFMASWHLSHARQEPHSEIENAPEADAEGRDIAQSDEDGSDGAEGDMARWTRNSKRGDPCP